MHARSHAPCAPDHTLSGRLLHSGLHAIHFRSRRPTHYSTHAPDTPVDTSPNVWSTTRRIWIRAIADAHGVVERPQCQRGDVPVPEAEASCPLNVLGRLSLYLARTTSGIILLLQRRNPVRQSSGPILTFRVHKPVSTSPALITKPRAAMATSNRSIGVPVAFLWK